MTTQNEMQPLAPVVTGELDKDYKSKNGVLELKVTVSEREIATVLRMKGGPVDIMGTQTEIPDGSSEEDQAEFPTDGGNPEDDMLDPETVDDFEPEPLPEEEEAPEDEA